jgi:hypothetical protein
MRLPLHLFPQVMAKKIQTFTVICSWHSGIDACDDWQRVTVVIEGVGSAQEAADNACLYLIWDRQGQAEPMLVVAGNPKLFEVHCTNFDAEEYDETITFSGKIVSVRE